MFEKETKAERRQYIPSPRIYTEGETNVHCGTELTSASDTRAFRKECCQGMDESKRVFDDPEDDCDNEVRA